jgi:hypothetical protein
MNANRERVQLPWAWLALLVVGLVVAWRTWPRLAPAKAVDDRSAEQCPSRVQGATSCAAAACHGGTGPLGGKGKGSEYMTWIALDPHSKAFTVLLREASRSIQRNLYGKRAPDASSDSLCLRCHTTPNIDKAYYPEGVGCEACHGPAEGWRLEHYRDPWKLKSAQEKSGRGMTLTKDLKVRAEVCAGCHVGSPLASVNHDLIAAGHPRLDFEFSVFLAVLPKHWDVANDRKSYADFEARAWAVGQAVTARQALRVLADRAGPTKPWPEFAEYDCFACHHDLQGKSWRQKRDLQLGGGSSPGRPRWGSWYVALLPHALAFPDGEFQELDRIEQLKIEMGKIKPDRKSIADQAEKLAKSLEQMAVQLARNDHPASRKALEDFFKRIAEDKWHVADTGWDGAAQLYLALEALYHADAEAEQVRSLLTILRRQLEFPGKKSDSPAEAQVPSRQEKFHQALSDLQQQLQTRP